MAIAKTKRVCDFAKQMSAEHKNGFNIPDDFTVSEIRGLISELRSINSFVYESCGIYESGKGLDMIWSFGGT